MATNGTATQEVIELKEFRPSTNDVHTVSPKHRNIVMMHLGGMTNAAIGRFLDCTEATIASILALPTVARYTMQLQSTFVDDLRPIALRVNESIEQHSERAAKVIFEIMESMHEREEIRAQQVALASAQDILDRAGHKPKVQVESKNLHGFVVSDSTLEKMAQVIRELPKALE